MKPFFLSQAMVKPTWRGLDEAARARPPEALLAEHPTLMKRPVIETGKVLTLGWSDAIAARHIAA